MREIRYIRHDEIDREKWDACVSGAVNGQVYAWTWYLDAVSPEWDALVYQDYEAIMPLSHRKKWGIPYLYRPLLSQQQGVFSRNLELTAQADDFLHAIPGRFRLAEITLNKYNQTGQGPYSCRALTTYELDLVSPYEDLRKAYKKNTQRNLAQSEKRELNMDWSPEAEELIRLLWNDAGKGSEILRSPQNLKSLHRLISALKHHQAGTLAGVRDAHGTLQAAALFAYSHQKWYYLVPASTSEGKEARAQFFLIDQFIRKEAGKALTLDFEGSEIPGVARFYSGFGAQPCTYCFIRINRLPAWAKFIKRLST